MFDDRGLVGRLAIACTIFVLSAANSPGGENPGKRKPTGDRTGSVAASDKKTSDTKPPGKKTLDMTPIVQLICDPRVQADLSLNERQVQAVQAAYAKIEPRFWLLRDMNVGPGADEKAEAASSLRTELRTILQPPQATRLEQLLLQAQGWPGVTSEAVVRAVRLSTDQLRDIEQVIEQTQTDIKKISVSSDLPDARQKSIQELRKREGASIQKLLSKSQRNGLSELVGTTYDLSAVRPLTFQAPELKQVDEWINSPPLKLADLRGKVVAFHFWAFGCINCVHNLPHYTKWHDELASKGLVVLGMHTPETEAERNVAALQKKVAENAINYPVAVDHDAQNWSAWANSMWPSVYLVDKKGRVRYWWYGEMNWQGTEGEKFMRQQIEVLLAEKPLP